MVAHPPCNRWSKLATCRRQRDGLDGGCFSAALTTVRRYGGVLEHPAYSLAWETFGLARPSSRGWTQALGDDGWTCEVDQRLYGHETRKPTWLYVHGVDPPAMLWGRGPLSDKSIQASYGGGKRQALRSRTPERFRDVLVEIARSAQPSLAILACAP